MTSNSESAPEEQRLQADITALRTRIADTRELYREDCALRKLVSFN